MIIGVISIVLSLTSIVIVLLAERGRKRLEKDEGKKGG